MMSQHFLETKTPDGKDVTVLMGWDRPLQHIHCTVFGEPLAEHRSGENLLYSSLDDGIPFKRRVPLTYYIDLLVGSFGLAIPDSMLWDIQRDADYNVGNREVWHEAKSSEGR